MKIYLKLLIIFCLFFFHSSFIFSQVVYFQKVQDESSIVIKNDITKHLKSYTIYKIDIVNLRKYLASAPLEYTSSVGLMLEVPLPNGNTEIFNCFESPILSPEVAALHPEIKTYACTGTQHHAYNMRFAFTSEGFNAIIIGVKGNAVFFEKLKTEAESPAYISYYAKDALSYQGKKNSNNRCG